MAISSDELVTLESGRMTVVVSSSVIDVDAVAEVPSPLVLLGSRGAGADVVLLDEAVSDAENVKVISPVEDSALSADELVTLESGRMTVVVSSSVIDVDAVPSLLVLLKRNVSPREVVPLVTVV